MLCTEGSLRQDLPDRSRYITLYCRSWHCETCAPRRKREVVKEALAGKPRIFLTLTSRRRSGDDAGQAARELVGAWRSIHRRAKRRYGYKRLDYFAVLEKTKHGWPHLHLLLRAKWLDQDWISKEMDRLTGSPVVDIRKVKGRRKAAWYVSKYLAKDPEQFPGCKRYWRTQTWHRLRSEPDEDSRTPSETWSVVPMSPLDVAEFCEVYGIPYHWEGDAVVRFHEPPPATRRRRMRDQLPDP